MAVILNVAALFDCDSFCGPIVYDTPCMYFILIVICPCSPFEIVALSVRRFDYGTP